MTKNCKNCYYNSDFVPMFPSCSKHKKRIDDLDNVCKEWRESK